MSSTSRSAAQPKRRLRATIAAVLLGSTVLTGTALLSPPPSAAAQTQGQTQTQTTQPVQTQPVAGLPGSFAPLVDRVAPAVVTVTAAHEAPKQAERQAQPQSPFPPGSPFDEFFRRFGMPFDQPDQGGPEQHGGTALGSGFIIDGGGYVVTNNHVIDGADKVTVTLNDSTKLPAEIVGRDPKTDLALLKVKSDKPLPYLAFGDSDNTKVGDWVIAVGNPFGLGGTVTTGIVSARGRQISEGPYDDFIQTDAAINRGNSGGPMFNTDGQVIGINTAIYSPNGGSVGIGFAIPSNLAKSVVAQLRESGHVERGWLGVRIQQVTPEIADSLGLDKAHGALVADVTDGSPAAKAGLKQGDVILDYNHKPITELRDLTRKVADTHAGDNVPLEVLRGGKHVELTAHIERQPADMQAAMAEGGHAKKSAAEAVQGLQLAPLDAASRERLGIDDGVTGVVVTGLTDQAGNVPVQPGDVILKVGDARVKTPSDVAHSVEEARKSGQKAVLLLINRQGSQSFVALKLSRA